MIKTSLEGSFTKNVKLPLIPSYLHLKDFNCHLHNVDMTYHLQTTSISETVTFKQTLSSIFSHYEKIVKSFLSFIDVFHEQPPNNPALPYTNDNGSRTYLNNN